jgi:hypothetical protein
MDGVEGGARRALQEGPGSIFDRGEHKTINIDRGYLVRWSYGGLLSRGLHWHREPFYWVLGLTFLFIDPGLGHVADCLRSGTEIGWALIPAQMQSPGHH